jgi:hypothetical protein
VIDKDINGMAAINTEELISVNSKGCTVYADGKVAALVGVEDLVVVSTPDAILVASVNAAQDVKNVVDIYCAVVNAIIHVSFINHLKCLPNRYPKGSRT